jgi:succinate dehydrogenase hydrophobic anchor subunit
MKLFVEDWKDFHRWWSVRVSAVLLVLLAAIPSLADQYPQLAPSLLALFPKHGQEWVPIVGVLLTVAARVVSQAGLIDSIKRLFGKGGSDGVQ